MIATNFDMSKIDIKSIEEIISKKTGKVIELDCGKYKIFKITDHEFAEKYFIKI